MNLTIAIQNTIEQNTAIAWKSFLRCWTEKKCTISASPATNLKLYLNSAYQVEGSSTLSTETILTMLQQDKLTRSSQMVVHLPAAHQMPVTGHTFGPFILWLAIYQLHHHSWQLPSHLFVPLQRQVAAWHPDKPHVVEMVHPREEPGITEWTVSYLKLWTALDDVLKRQITISSENENETPQWQAWPRERQGPPNVSTVPLSSLFLTAQQRCDHKFTHCCFFYETGGNYPLLIIIKLKE
jgi:hypothetical protein